ncbi:MAG: MFS transporter [Lactobacillus sp.]
MINTGSKKGLAAKLGFKDHKQFTGFLSVVFAGQLIYSCFEALKGVFYVPLMHLLHMNNAQLGVIFSLIGIAIFFSIPGGWVNNRFAVKTILITSIMIRMITIFIMLLANPSFAAMKVIAIIWGIVEGIFWPAVLNGINLFTNKNNKGVAFGLLESLRRLMEMLMNLLLVGVMSLGGGVAILKFSQMQIFRAGLIVYNLLLIPLCIFIAKYVPKNGIAAEKKSSNGSKGKDALVGLFQVIKMPKLWVAAITAFTIYWSYIAAVYAVPYLQTIYKLPQAEASLFGTISTAGIGIIASFLSGIISDKMLHSTGKMICLSLAIVFVAMLLILLLPKNAGMLWPTMIILLLFSCGMFMAKGIFMVPASQIPMPEKYRGAAMSVSYFIAYAPNLFAYTIDGHIIDNHAPLTAYSLIFVTETIMALVGVLMAVVLIRIENKEKAQKQ